MLGTQRDVVIMKIHNELIAAVIIAAIIFAAAIPVGMILTLIIILL